MLKRIRDARVLAERPLEGGERTVEVASGREDEAAAALDHRERPRAVEGAGPRLHGGEHLLGLLELLRREQRLDEVAQLESHGRLEHERRVAQLVSAPQVWQRRAGVAESELEGAEHPAEARPLR